MAIEYRGMTTSELIGYSEIDCIQTGGYVSSLMNMIKNAIEELKLENITKQLKINGINSDYLFNEITTPEKINETAEEIRTQLTSLCKLEHVSVTFDFTSRYHIYSIHYNGI